MSITVQGVSKRFGNFTALDSVSLEVGRGELVALLGPSGSGKTTLLRVIAGLELPDAGRVMVDGRDVTGLGPAARRIGFVFQHYALFGHMTVEANVAFGLRVGPRAARPTREATRERVRELLSLVQLDWAALRYPAQLSGGQRQRVALARALAVRPDVLLLDEPFGALDAAVRTELRDWLRRLHDEIHLTSVFVTHDQEEALEIADRVVVFNAGRIEQDGTPVEVYDRPVSEFVYRFLGVANDLDGALSRPHDLRLSHDEQPGTQLGHVRRVHLIGPSVRVEIERDSDGALLRAELTRGDLAHLNLEVGDLVHYQVGRFTRFRGENTIFGSTIRQR